jgi:hypothetical protein
VTKAFSGLRSILLACASLLIVCTAGYALRPYTSMETIIKRTPIVIEASITAQTKVKSPTPTQDNILYGTTTALQLTLTDIKVWKPKPFPKKVSVYSRVLEEAPCTGAAVENGKRYIVFGQFDSSKKYILADLCDAFVDASSSGGSDIKKTIISIYGKPHKFP